MVPSVINDNYNKHEKLGNISIMALTPKEKRAKEALSRLLTEKNKECASVIEEILNKIYADIKGLIPRGIRLTAQDACLSVCRCFRTAVRAVAELF